MRIMIVDDSATARMFIRRCMEIIGFSEADFVEAEHGKDALNKIKQEQADLMLTDLTMPVMDGETLLKWMKSNPKLCDIPVLVISSAGNPAKEKELLSLGAIGVLSKPVSPAKLHDVLQSFLEEGEEAYE